MSHRFSRQKRCSQRFIELLESRRLMAASGVGVGPQAVIAADLNADGRIDLATANYQGHSISILLGGGNGSFAASSTINVNANGQVYLAAGDFNGDGMLDLATYQDGTHTVLILSGTGGGAFGAPTTIAGVIAARAQFAAADFNGDGRTDLAVGTYGANGYTILLGNTNRTFTQVSVSTSFNADALAAADFNRDGKVDLAAATGSQQLVVSLGNGNGTFSSPTNFVIPNLATFLTTGDFNGDGNIDLAMCSDVISSRPPVVAIYGTGTGTFGSSQGFNPVGAKLVHVVAADFTGDGKTDLAVAGDTANAVGILISTGSSFTTGAAVAVTDPGYLAVGDFDGDGKLDLASASPNDNTVSVFVGRGNGTFAPTPDNAFAVPTTVSVGSNPEAITGGDFNADGKSDLAVANQNSNTVSILLGNNNGTFASAGAVAAGAQPIGVVTGDFNADEKLDLAVADYAGSRVSILLGNGNGTFAAATSVATGAAPASIVTGDFNGDGKTDLATANAATNGTVSILLGNGSGSFATAPSIAVGSFAISVVTGDFNRDGKLDLATANYVGNTVSLLLGRGDGTFLSFASLDVGLAPNCVATSDLNGDGNPDLVTANYAGRSVSILLGTGHGTFDVARSVSVGSGPASIAVGDFNSDGRIDLATADFAANTLSILIGNGDGTFLGAPSLVTGVQPSAITLGDFNGDGKADLAATIAGGNNIAIALNQASVDSTYVAEAGGVVTISGATTPFTISEGSGVLSVTTPNGTRRLTASAINGVVLNGVNVTVVSDLGAAGSSGHVSFTVSNSSSVTFASTEHLAALSISGLASVTAGGEKLLRVTTLTIAAGRKLELNDDDLVATNTSASTILNFIRTAYNFGGWDGPSGIFSNTAKINPRGNTMLGLLSGTEYFNNNGSPTFDGVNVSSTDVLVKYTYFGDVDFNGAVDSIDYNLIDFGFLTHASGWSNGDVDYSGASPDSTDYNLIDFAFVSQNGNL